MAKKDELKAKAKGMVQKVKDKVSGDGAIYAELKKDHRMVSELMESILSATEDVDRRLELYPEIRTSLLAHALAEQRQFYAALIRYPETQPLAQNHQDDHDHIEQLLAELDRIDVTEARWLTVFRDLHVAVDGHVATEEHELFAAAKQVLSDDEAKDIATRFKAEKRDIKQRLESGEIARPRPEAS